jgi:UDP-2-acetamido-2,6-beta-L-arabino-hexul-4-ose reductase
MNIGITGQSGFIGSHLTNYFTQKCFNVIPVKKESFSSSRKLCCELKDCSTVIHLAGMNRGLDKEVHDCNVYLASQLVSALEQGNLTPNVLFASSTQEETDNLYGQSKKEATDIFIKWAKRNNATFTSLILPNIFGPFCKPNYNSVIATFCYQLTHNQDPIIQVDKSLKLIYVKDLVEQIFKLVETPSKDYRVYLKADKELLVSEILTMLTHFKKLYFENHIFPCLKDTFNVQLFNTFRSYIDPGYFPIKGIVQSDKRGNLVEAVKEKTGGQMFYSSTKNGMTRGNHYHSRKIERFYVIKGLGSIRIRKIGTDDVFEYKVSGNEPAFVDIPIDYAHNITNIGDEDLITLFWTNELFNAQDSDTFPENV